MHKRITMLFIVTLLAIGMVACGNEESETTPTPEPVAESADASTADTEAAAAIETTSTDLSYPVVDTNQGFCYNNSEQFDCPAEAEVFYG